MLSEGRHEIESARQRLAAAKTQASAASKNMEAAKLMMENAKSLLESSSKEVDAAKKCLSEAEKRWEVIEIDEEEPDDLLNNDHSRKKKRKVSVVEPHGSNNNSNYSAGNNVSRSNADERGRNGGATTPTAISSTAPVVTPGRERAIGASATTPAASSSSISNNVTRVVVEGCGISVVNGTYTQVVELLNDGAPSFWKKGWWGGKLCKHAIYRRKFNNTNIWVFGYLDDEGGGRSMKRLYTSRVNANSLTPPEDGWDAFVRNGGVYPPPKCRIIYDKDTTAGGVGVRDTTAPSSSTATTASPSPSINADQIVVEGCGRSDLNGIYTREVGVLNEGAAVYTKRGSLGGTPCKHAIYRGVLSFGTYIWYFGYLKEWGPSERLYASHHRHGRSLTPPEDSWIAIYGNGGVDPPPKCRIIYDNDTTSGGYVN